MELEYIRQLLKIFDESTAAELTIDSEGTSIHIARNRFEPAAIPMQQIMMAQAPQAVTQAPPQTAAPTPSSPAPAADTTVHTIMSPIVGTFYRASNPGSDPFVQVGSRVSTGDTLCIVEAMKLMNSIESDCAGTVIKVLVENGQPVEYNQPLFVIKPD